MQTLLIIDMQKAWLEQPNHVFFELPAVVERINHAARSVRASGGQVSFVMHNDAEAPLDSSEWQLIPSIEVAEGDLSVDKQACDSFTATDLLPMLSDNATSKLVLCGFATEFCFDTAVRAAATKGFDVTVLADAHTTSNRPHLDASSIVTHHNWIWSNMSVPVGNTLTVVKTLEAFPA
ncbi:MAG: isochorismatase family protein [Burkholderiales bacterium]|nr:isochorismatase family protein [Burkholderiales bacterium]